MSSINHTISEPGPKRTAALRGAASQHSFSTFAADCVAQRENDEFLGARQSAGHGPPQVAAALALRLTTATAPRPHAREALGEYCEVSQVNEAWGMHVVEQLTDLRRLTIEERGKGAAQALFNIYYAADDIERYRVYANRLTLKGLPLKLGIIHQDLAEAQAVVAQMQKNMARAEGVLAGTDVLEQASYLNQAYTHGSDFLDRYVDDMLLEDRFFSHLVNQSAQAFKPMLCMRQLDICAPFAAPSERGRHRVHHIASPAVLDDVPQSLALLAAKPSPQGEERPARPARTLRQAVQESGAAHLAELAQALELEPRKVDADAARASRASRASATTHSTHEAANLELSEENEESEDWWSSQTAPCASTPAQESASDRPAPARKDRAKYKPRRLRVQKQAPVGTVTSATAKPATAKPVGRPIRVDPVITFSERSRQTLTLLLQKPYRQSVTVQDYLHLLTEFIQRGRSCGYLKHVQHMQDKNNGRDGFHLNLGIGESLYFVRFDGNKCWASFHYPHDRDGHNHSKIPKEYRAAYAKVFENFSVSCA